MVVGTTGSGQLVGALVAGQSYLFSADPTLLGLPNGLAKSFTGSGTASISFVDAPDSDADGVADDGDASGAELAFQSSASAIGCYTPIGPGVAAADVPIVGGTLPLPTAGSYELSVRQLYSGGAATSPFSGSTSSKLGLVVRNAPMAALANRLGARSLR